MAVPTKANVSRPAAYGYDVLIEYGDQDSESLYLRAAVGPGRQLTFQTVEPQSKGPSTVENPEDMRSESGTTFSRSDFSGGEGLRRAHRRNGTDSDWSRFFSSVGVDTDDDAKGEPGPLRLQYELDLIEDDFPAGSTGFVHYDSGADDVVLFAAANDVDVYRMNDIVVWFPAADFNTEDPHDGEGDQFVADLVKLGDHVYAAVGPNGIHQRTEGQGHVGSWAHWSDLQNADSLWAVKGRIVAAVDEALYEAAAGSDSVLLHTLPDSVTWVEVVDGGTVILAAASNGTIFHFAEEEGELVLVGETAIGEEIQSIAATHGVVLIGTYTHLYRGAVIGQRIAQIQLLRQFPRSGAFAGGARALTVVGTNVYFIAPGAIWRYNLVTGGLMEHAAVTNLAAGEILPVGEVPYLFAGDGYRQDRSNYVTSGYLISPLADFYSDETKVWREVRLRLGAMPSGTSVSLAYSTDPAAIDNPSHTSWTTAINAVTTTGEHRADLIDIESRWIALKVTLATSNTANTPEVLSFAARGLLKPTEMDWQIPINVSDRLELPHRRPQLVPGLGEQVRDSMLELVGKVATVTLLRPDEQVVGQITGISEPIQEIPERGSPSVYALLQIRGERQT